MGVFYVVLLGLEWIANLHDNESLKGHLIGGMHKEECSFYCWVAHILSWILQNPFQLSPTASITCIYRSGFVYESGELLEKTKVPDVQEHQIEVFVDTQMRSQIPW